MSQTLSVNRIINISMVLGATAAANRGFGGLLILGSTPIIDTAERIRSYSDIIALGVDFDTTTNEYKAGLKFFSQQPKPVTLFVGRWAQTATSAVLQGASLSSASQAIANFTAITTGSMSLTIDGTPHALSGIDFSGATNLNGVAAIITTALSSAGVVTWDAGYSRFVATSATTGATSTIGYATGTGLGQDISALVGLTSGVGGSPVANPPVNGIAPETLLEAVVNLAGISNDWYGLSIAAAIATDADRISVSEFIEAADPPRIVGFTTQGSDALNPTSTTDIAYVLKSMNFSRSFVIYSSSSPFADASLFGRLLTTNFNANNSTITLMFKQLPSIAAEGLNPIQADALKNKNCNVFAAYNNGTAIIQFGTMASGVFIDETHNDDWMQNYLQTAVWNFMITNPTKTPQTDGGMNSILGVIEHALEQGVANQMLAPGVWNGPSFGALNTGEYLSKGYYAYAPSVDTQQTADRIARKAVPPQIALKLAGAIHSADVLVNVNP